MKTADTAHHEGPSPFAQAAELELRSVSKRYLGQREPAISDLSLTVPAGEVCVLVGPSGSGKTTAMRLINRMIALSGGDILLGGRSVLAREPRELRREIGYVIQQVGLFPHQTVGENIATVPRLLGWAKDRTAARVRELLELIGLDAGEMAGRYPAQLSGGQRQRVGVARALAADPPLMLMDEPFGAIDPINRARLQDEFQSLQQKVKKTVVFVTHDIDEAIKMGDRIAILREGGVLAQYDTPGEILARPADEFVAQFVGADRALKRLSLTTVAELPLAAANGASATDGGNAADGASGTRGAHGENGDVAPRIPRETSVRDALSLMLSAGGRPLAVTDGDGRVLGRVTLAQVEQLLSDERAPRAADGAAGAAAGAADAAGAAGAADGTGATADTSAGAASAARAHDGQAGAASAREGAR
ncbi:MAG TPA: ABC transporter ATP-binding protein [Solirubrobacteraceae bacterium]|nr:ABC transporter ATP-binding protein [Solirubrobacteraceae bacterium]